ncbi:MAG: hypothetical protein JWL63_2713 [Rhodocyclales bacterium]|nr:hypothetical protein [Rhodocyclales bacterium]
MAAGFFVLMLCSIIYFLPSMLAKQKGHVSGGSVFLLNLLLGWTVLGWFGALIWAGSGPFATKKVDEKRVKCPDCAELILPDARKCKHCGKSLVTAT